MTSREVIRHPREDRSLNARRIAMKNLMRALTIAAYVAASHSPVSAVGIEGFANRKIDGAFVQITSSNAINGNIWWKSQVQDMASLGMDTLVIQYAALDGIAFYPQSRSFTTTLNGIGSGANDHNPIRAILEEAETQGIGVFLGVYSDSSFDSYLTTGSTSGSSIVQATIDNAKDSLDDLESLYGWDPSANGGSGASRYDSLAGWYIPQEINNFVALTASPWDHDREIIDYTKQLSNYAKTETGLQTMISPYFNLNLDMEYSGQTYAEWWDEEALDTASGGFDVDIVAMQDGVGAGIVGHTDPGLRRHATVITAAEQFAELTNVFDQHDEEFWGNVEAFDHTTSGVTQANFTQFRNQITAVAPHVDRTIQFDFPHYLSSAPLNPKYAGTGTGGIPAAADHLFVKYEDYAAAEQERLDVKRYWYEPDSLGAAFYSQAADPNDTLLADLSTGALDIPPGSSAFVNGTWVGFDKSNSTSGGGVSNEHPQIVFDLYSAQEVDHVELFFFEDSSAGILSPGLNSIAISAGSTDDPSTYSTVTPVSSAQNYALGESGLKLVQMIFDLDGETARYFSFTITTTNTYVFLGEVAFYEGTGGAAITPIPEPATLGLSAWTLAVVCWAAGRSRGIGSAG
jgi:hypothetical protein